MKVKKQATIWWYSCLASLLASLVLLAGCGDNPGSGSAPQTTIPANTPVIPATTAASSTTSLAAVTTSIPSSPAASSPTAPATSPTANSKKSSLEIVSDIALPGDTSRFDYQSLDPQTNLLFIAHLGASSVIAFDTTQNKVVATITGIASVHGVLAVSQLGRVYASATGDKQVAVIDEKTFQVIAKIPAGQYPDGLAYDLQNHALYISDEGGTSESVINTQTNKLITTIDLGGEAGNTQYDPVTGHILIDVQTLNQLVAVDPQTNKILARYPLSGCQNDHSLALDASQRLAFITCDGNARLLVLDLQTMQTIYEDSVGAGPDVLALDTGRSLLYVACESGIVSIFDESQPLTIRKVWEGFVAKEAHTISINNQNQQLYLPLEDINGKPVLRIMKFS